MPRCPHRRAQAGQLRDGCGHQDPPGCTAVRDRSRHLRRRGRYHRLDRPGFSTRISFCFGQYVRSRGSPAGGWPIMCQYRRF